MVAPCGRERGRDRSSFKAAPSDGYTLFILYFLFKKSCDTLKTLSPLSQLTAALLNETRELREIALSALGDCCTQQCAN